MVNESWWIEVHDGWMTCKLKEKLKALKRTLKVLSKEVIYNLEFKIKMCSDKLQSLELRAESDHLSINDLNNR